ncbi:MAG: long-chain fatty acid--CoA ligase [Candidatus Rokuibacteriota bacterium]|nr:MAG: long-chain fatty acid--CoA ligase [Candidatus Rokubacteria bacterium]
MSGNFAGLIEAVARRRPEHPALRWDGGAMTYGELAAAAHDFAARVRARGLGAGHRLAITLTNRPELAIAVLGGLAAGTTVAPLDPLLKTEERDDILADLAPALVVESDVAGQPREHATGAAARGTPAALVLYTSGSTGRPKGAVLSHAALAFANHSWAGPVIGLRDDDVVLAALPLSHAFGLNGALLAPLLAGVTVRLVERFVPDAVAEVLARDGVTVLPGVATMFHRLLELPDFKGAPRLRLGVSGAAPCPWELAQAWRARTGVRIVRGYGSTELFRPLSYLAADATDYPDCVGRPVPGVEIRVVDDDGHAVAAGEDGELLIRTPAVMDGYLGNAAETAAVLAGGWYSTGDLARLTPDGYVAIVGRKRERIKRGGYSVFPAEVETVLLAHPAVSEAAVVGVPDATLGEEVAAFVALRSGATPDELVAWCRERLAAFKYPRRITVLPTLPRSATGKVLKAQLR